MIPHPPPPCPAARGGFTLIELLVVLSIIGILLSFTGNRNTIVVERARDAAVMIDITHLRNAVHQFALDSDGSFPLALDDLHPRYLTRKIASWQGARSKGLFGYDPESGRVTLAGPDGSGPATALDSKGRRYGEY